MDLPEIFLKGLYDLLNHQARIRNRMKKLFSSLFVIVCLAGDTGTCAITATTSAAPIIASQLTNISTRAFVQTGDNVMIGGFIVQGTAIKEVDCSCYWS